MRKIQESKKKETRIMDSFIKKGWLFLVMAFLFPAFGAFAQDNMKKSKSDTTVKTKTIKNTSKSTRSTDTSSTYKYNQNMNQQNMNQNQQNRNRYDNQKGDTLQGNHSHDAVLIENNPKK